MGLFTKMFGTRSEREVKKLNATVDQRLEASFAQVTRRLEQVTSSLNAMQSLAGSVDELRKQLHSIKNYI